MRPDASVVYGPYWMIGPLERRREDDIDSLASAWEADLAIMETGHGHWPRPAKGPSSETTGRRRLRFGVGVDGGDDDRGRLDARLAKLEQVSF